MLNMEDENIHFYKEFVNDEFINGKRCLVFKAYLTYIPEYCPKCGSCYDEKIEKHGFKKSLIKIPAVSKLNTYLSLDKQRYHCHHCNKTFTCITNIINYGCNISNNTKHSIAADLTKKDQKKIFLLIIMFQLIQLKELLTPILNYIIKYIKILYHKHYHLMSLNQLNLLMAQ